MNSDRGGHAARGDAKVFRYEREMQEAVRHQLDQIEVGLVEADGGHERSVATGKIDVLARDLAGHFVVIELKIGPCPHGALEQVLAYSNDLEAETGTPCRAVLVAYQFSERIKAAAKRARDISLVTYERQSGLVKALPQPR
jgi:RecB family endonuclease NucS